MNQINARGYNIMSYVALAAMALIAAYDFFVPAPRSAMTQQQQKKSLGDVNKNIDAAQKQLNTATVDVKKYVWTGTADAITSQSLKSITAMAQNHRVQLVGLRPQKTGSVSGLTVLPYLVLLSGKFNDVYSVLHEMEAPSNKLALTTLQFTSSDEATDTVNATVTAVAYRLDSKGDK